MLTSPRPVHPHSSHNPCRIAGSNRITHACPQAHNLFAPRVCPRGGDAAANRSGSRPEEAQESTQLRAQGDALVTPGGMRGRGLSQRDKQIHQKQTFSAIKCTSLRWSRESTQGARQLSRDPP